jgi:hypothetical protein
VIKNGWNQLGILQYSMYMSFISEKVISVHFLTFSCRAHSRNTFVFGILLGSCVLQSICQSADLTVGSCIIDNN